MSLLQGARSLWDAAVTPWLPTCSPGTSVLRICAELRDHVTPFLWGRGSFALKKEGKKNHPNLGRVGFKKLNKKDRVN